LRDKSVDHLIYANRAALDRLEFASVEDLRNADPQALMGPYEVAGRPIVERGAVHLGPASIPRVRGADEDAAMSTHTARSVESRIRLWILRQEQRQRQGLPAGSVQRGRRDTQLNLAGQAPRHPRD
jgi:hypothetical protein